jgi:hypothetical protein
MYSASKIGCSGQQPAMEISSMDMPNLISMVKTTGVGQRAKYQYGEPYSF